MVLAPTSICPNCRRACALDAMSCASCQAVFSAGSAWKPRLLQPGEQPAPAAAIAAPAVVTTETPAKGGHRWLLWALGVPAGLFVVAMVIGANSPETIAQAQRERRADQVCDQMMSDSVTRGERQTTRAICDQVKANIRNDKR